MNRRWYDQEPTLSMAISLLQNANHHHQNYVYEHLKYRIQELYPIVYQKHFIDAQETNVMPWLRRRTQLEPETWHLLESMRYMTPGDRDRVAKEIIHWLHALEINSPTALCDAVL